MHEIKCKTVAELKAAFNNNKKAVWGFVLYAHGNKFGTITDSAGKDRINQNDLMTLVDAQGYKLAKLYLMQCDSGSNGLFSITIPYSEVFKAFQNEFSVQEVQAMKKRPKHDFLMKALPGYTKYYKNMAASTENLEYKDCFIKGDAIIVVFYAEWGSAWDKRTIKNKTNISYQGTNALGSDWGFLEKKPSKK